VGAGSQQIALVRSKLRRPVVRTPLVSRERLLGRLRDGRGRRLTLVCAPAGYGKTTLLAQWCAADHESTQFVWLFADEADADPIRLWSHVVHGLRSVHPEVGEASLETVTAGARALETRVIPSLLEELESVPATVLVLEDWHRIDNPLCDQTLWSFVERVPPSVQVVLSCRADPRLPVARLRAHDELAEVREAQLRLSPEEAAELFRAAEIVLASDEIEGLTRRTEGWVTGLHLTSLLLGERRDRSAFVAEFTAESRHVLDYLASDVLAAAPADLRSFLIRTSVLEYLTPSLCDAVLERADSAAMLARVERANLFVAALDERGDVLRYHQLFASMLRRELERSEADQVAGLHARASAWFEANHEVESAIEHAIAAHDVPRSSELVAAHARTFWNAGRAATVDRWLDALSWPEAAADPQLALIRAAVCAQNGGRPDEVERWLESAAADAESGPVANGLHSIQSGISILRSIYLTRGIETAAAEAHRALELEPSTSSWRRQTLLGLGQSLYFLGRAREARMPLQEARHLGGASENAAAAANVLAYLALVELDTGNDPATAEHLSRDAVSMLEDQRLSATFVATNPHIALGRALAAGTDLHGAIEQLERAAALSAPAGPGYWHAHALLSLAQARQHTGDAAGARDALESARLELDALPDTGMLGSILAETESQLQAPQRREGFLGEPLSESEIRVLRLLAADRSLRAAAKELFLSTNTVKTHRRTIYRKLGARTREEAIARAHTLGLV
jgi:LuxR family transcriptional regulator, maltose regulon positive regulatory protein